MASPIPLGSDLTGFSYVHSITDDKTRFSFVYFLKEKDDAYKIFEKIFPLVATQFNAKVALLPAV